MAHYILLTQFTDQGIRNVKDTVKRARAFKEMAKGMGVNVVQEYWTLGHYDIVLILDGKDDETMAALAMKVCSLGNVKTQSLRGFDEKEMESILSRV